MTLPLTKRLRKATQVERLRNRARPTWVASGVFPGGREIVYTLAVQRLTARQKLQQEQTNAAVAEAVATGEGSSISPSGGVQFKGLRNGNPNGVETL